MLYNGGICFLTAWEAACGSPLEKQAVAALEAGIKWVQLRMKGASRRRVWEAALALRGPVLSAGALLSINDYPDIALAARAGGVHLGQEDFPPREARALFGKNKKLIGVSTHSLEEAKAAEADGADYIGFGPIFETRTKDAGPAKGTDSLEKICCAVSIPVVAIGGITPENIGTAIRAGAAAAAVSGAIASGDAGENVRRFLAALEAV